MCRNVKDFPLHIEIRKNSKLMNSGVSIYYDVRFEEELISFLSTRMEKMLVRLDWMLRGVHSYNDKLYSNYTFAPGISIIKFKHEETNPRLICREIFSTDRKSKKIVIVELFLKKTDKIDKKYLGRINSVKGYNYGN